MGAHIAQLLLEARAVLLRPNEPFTYASGLKGPVYCDHRLLLGDPEARNAITEAFVKLAQHYPCDVVAGTATAGIPWATLIADRLGKPMIYIRSAAKPHGWQNQIEGISPEGRQVLLVEDLINTGGSSLHAVEALRHAGANVSACLAITTYKLQRAEEQFQQADCVLETLTDINEIIDVALQQGIITEDEQHLLRAWQEHPEEWT